ncbi:MAG: Spy/CpxP family protein refolding chaperone, partial [Planctomycetota bacterium]
AMTTLDTARGLPSVTDAQRTQIDALRGEQAAYHRELCDRLAGLLMAESVGPTASTGGSKKAKEPRTSMEDTRFERSELNARSLRRLKSILTDEQVRAIPALVKTAAKQVQEGAVGMNGAGLSPAPTPAAPVQK